MQCAFCQWLVEAALGARAAAPYARESLVWLLERSAGLLYVLPCKRRNRPTHNSTTEADLKATEESQIRNEGKARVSGLCLRVTAEKTALKTLRFVFASRQI